MATLRAVGRGRNYSPLRGLVEIGLRAVWRGGWGGELWGRLPGRVEVRVVRETIHVTGLLQPLRLGFASDLHIGPTTPIALLERAFATLAEANLDLLLLGGDYVFLDATPEVAATLERLVAAVPARAKAAVMGNHDLWTHHDRLEDALRAAGAAVLVNDALRLPSPHGEVAVVGLDEPWTGEPDAERAFAAAGDAAVRIALAHAPEGLPHVAGRGAALLLAGHTHGGHIALPGPRPVIVPGPISRAHPMGWYEVEDTRLFVSRGLGGIELPIRAFAPPDVLVAELVPRAG